MKRTVLLVLAVLAVSLPSADQASARRGFRRAPAHESACRELDGALFGLCRAYCDALRCEDDDDRRACERLHHLFEQVSGGASLPCEAVEPPAMCGDGVVNQVEEVCDDGNNDSCDGCSFDCQAESCGDGIVCAPEECEAGDVCSNGESCSDTCTCPAPPEPQPCGFDGEGVCGGACPDGLTCTDLGTGAFCECFFL